MTPDDLTRALKPATKKLRRGIVLPIMAAAVCGALSGLVFLFASDLHLGRPLSPLPMPQSTSATSAQQPVLTVRPAEVTPAPKTVTVTVVDSQTGAKRQVVLPASTNDQAEGGEFALSPATATATPPDSAGVATKPKTKRH